jgi:hypothetical protein
MLQEVFQQLLQNTYTSDTLYQRIRLLKEYYETHLYSQNEEGQHITIENFCAQKSIDPDTTEALTAWERYFHEHTSGAEESIKTLHELEQNIHLLPSIVVYLPLIFDNQEIAKIAGWFRTNVRKDMILEVKIDANVTGGCALIWNNTYYDFSLRYFMRKERAGIVSMLNAYGSPN